MKTIKKGILGLLALLVTLSCTEEKKSSAFDLIQGKWKLSKVEWSTGTVDNVPQENSYYFILNSSKSANNFIIDGNKGSWSFSDSIIFMNYMPNEVHSKVDSLVILKKENSYVAEFKSGDEKVLTIDENGVHPEQLSTMMELILVTKNELQLYSDGSLYIYSKENIKET